MTTNHTNPQSEQQLAILRLLHAERGFFSTDRQRQLYETLLSAPRPAPETTQDADRLTLLGYGGAETRRLPSSPVAGGDAAACPGLGPGGRGGASPGSKSPSSETEAAAPPYRLMTDSLDQ